LVIPMHSNVEALVSKIIIETLEGEA